MQKLEVTLPDGLDRFISKEIELGHYQNASEVVSAALAAFENVEGYDEAEITALRAAIDEGDASGVAEGNVFEEIRQRLKRRLEQ